MIGQRNNLALLNSLPELPHFVIAVGPKGSGRRTLLSEAFSRRGMRLVPLDGKVESVREAVEAAGGSERTAFAIDASDLSATAPGALLKTTEECPPNAWFCLLAESDGLVLPTLMSRGFVIRMEPYSAEDLREYASSMSEAGFPEADVARASLYAPTFGGMASLLSLPDKGESLCAFAEKVVAHVLRAPLYNALMIPSHMAMRGEAGKHRPDLLLDAVSLILSRVEPSESVLRMAEATGRARFLLGNKGLNRQMILDMWVLEMRGERRWNSAF